MSERGAAIAELVVRVRAGEQPALAELLDCLAEDMGHVAEAELKAINSPRDPREVWQQARRNAQLRFAEFQGTTARELTDWLRGVVLREIRRPGSVPIAGAGLETIAPRAAELDTIAPGSAVTPPPNSPLTVHKSSDQTHVIKSPNAQTPGVSGTPSSSPPDGEPQVGSASLTSSDPLGGSGPSGGSEQSAGSGQSSDPDQPVDDANGAETQREAFDPLATVADLHATIPPASSDTSSAPAPALEVESFEDYEILSEIARGGMGVVYKARDRKLNRKVGLKMILAGQLANPEDIERFYIEAQAAAILRHKNIVGIHQVGEHDGRHYFSMDYIEGKSLADMIADGPLDPRDAARYLRKVAAAIQYAHDLDVLHRDLKPSNVLVDQRDEPLVTDFGLAKRTRQDDPVARGASGSAPEDRGSMVTMAGAIMGTPGYMPPEQAAGKVNEISARSDVYSLGATLYDLITGRPPTVGTDAWDTVKKVQEEDPVPPVELNPHISPDMNAICLKCLARDPQSRYATAQELADDLQRFLADMPVTARPASRAEHAWRWCRRNPRVASLAALSMMLFVTAFLGISLGYVRTRAALADARTSIDQMRRAIDTLYTEVSETEALNEPGLKQFRRKLLSRARQLYDQALERLGNDPALKEDLAGSQFRLAAIARELDSPSDALKILDEALKTQRGLLAETPKVLGRIRALGDTLNLRSQILEKLGKLDEALADADQARALRQSLVTPENEELKEQLAAASEDAAVFARLLINSQMNSGAIYKALWEDPNTDEQKRQAYYESAEKYFNLAQEQRKQLLAKLPDNARLHQDQAKGYYNLANLSHGASQEKQGLDYVNQAIEGFEFLLSDHAGTPLVGIEELELARIKFNLALCFKLKSDLSQDEQVMENLERARAILEKLVQDDPVTLEYMAWCAIIHQNIGDEHFSFGTPAGDAAALKAYDSAIALWKRLPTAQFGQNLADAVSRREEIQKIAAAAALPPEPEPPRTPEEPAASDPAATAPATP